MTDAEKLQLIKELYENGIKNTESFEVPGCGMMYLVGAIVTDTVYEVHMPPDETEQVFIDLLKEMFPDDEHDVWDYVCYLYDTTEEE